MSDQPYTPNSPNRNLLWANIFVDELARSGLKAVCIAPGSRSTPLVIAFAEHPSIRVYSHIDERSASFFALGLALASDQPVALLCSSGTATANFYPAIIEARYSRVPLLVLTADRPPELRDSGANQTVDQVKMYGDHVLWAVDAALPEAQPAAVTLRSLRTLAGRAYATANGMPKGVVHINFPFRKPLEPTLVSSDVTDDDTARPNGDPYTRITQGRVYVMTEQIDRLKGIIQSAQRGVIFAGSRTGAYPPDSLLDLAYNLHFLIFADPLSNVRFEPDQEWVIGGYDTFLRADKDISSPDVVLHFGGMPTSQALDDYLNADPSATRILISPDGTWTDAHHHIDEFMAADPRSLTALLSPPFFGVDDDKGDTTWIDRLRAAEFAVWESIDELQRDELFDGGAVGEAIDALPDNAVVFIGNSLPVRHLDTFARPSGKRLTVYCNRGASGIDGTVSSALGAAAAHPDRPLVLILGDLSFYHDMNGLLALKRCGVKATIIVINNDGGGIFYRLPVADFDPPFTDLFLTPHGLDFSHAAALYGLDYTRTADRTTFREAVKAAVSSDRSALIEVPTDIRRDEARRQEIIERVKEKLLPIEDTESKS